MNTPPLLKYPRTRHLLGSRLQPGDEDLTAARYGEIAGQHLVVGEKLDGANAGVCFGADGRLLLQSRGHYLAGGHREKHFALFKTWAACHQEALQNALDDRYILYGEWLFAKHTIFYDRLPHYFMEFDVFDRRTGVFLSTPRRRALLDGLPVVSVPVLAEGESSSIRALAERVGPSLYKSSESREALRRLAKREGLEVDQIVRETDPSAMSEGLYIKVEEGGEVLARFKWVRASFLTSVTESGSHWLNRPILPNQLEPGVDIFAPTLGAPGA